MNEDAKSAAWQDCPRGELQQMVGRHRADGRRDFLRKAAKGSAAVVLLGAGGIIASQWMLKEAEGRGQLACGRVMDLLPRYAAHELNTDLTRKVAAHLAKCPGCRAHYQEMIG